MKTLRYIILGALAVLATACVQDPDAPMNQPDLPTLSVDESTVTRVSMVVNGIFSKDMTDITEYGVEISETLFEAGGTYKTLVPQEIGADGFSLGVTGLTLNQTYFLRAFIGNGYSKLYSPTITQKTPESSVASISDVTIVDNQYFVATIEDNGGRNLEDVGFVWGEVNDRKSIRREKRYPGSLGADGKTITLPMSDIGKGTYYVLAYAEDDKDGTGFSRIPFELVLRDDVPPVKPEPEPDLTVDMGLSVLWSSVNVGAEAYYQIGTHYSWREDLLPTPGWDSPWRLPTRNEIEELIDNCSWQSTTDHDVYGFVATSKVNGNTLFFPAGGVQYSTEIGNLSFGEYWSSELDPDAINNAFRLQISENLVYCSSKYQKDGRLLRPVYGEKENIHVTGISLEEDVISLTVGSTRSIHATVTPFYASNPTVQWNSSNTEIASVEIVGDGAANTSDATITGLSAGTATITVSTADGGFTASVTVEVTEEGSITASKYLTFTSEGTTTISLNNTINTPIVYYSTDTVNWIQWDYSDLIFSVDAPLYLCGNNPKGFCENVYRWSTFTSSGDLFSISGDIMSLINRNADVLEVTPYCFMNLFSGCEQLKEAPTLSATSMAEHCYSSMFYGCTNLIRMPELPATSVAEYCYEGMFARCSSLTGVSKLPAMTLADYCYCGMFIECENLTDCPDLPATTLAPHCYEQMFMACSRLVNPPELPATSLVEYCYGNMFRGCTSLQDAPVLPAVSLASYCYEEMFRHCSSLAIAPTLPATQLAPRCYWAMFANCNNLIKAPQLPATNLAMACYAEMFFQCESLEEAPELPAIVLTRNCYDKMFYGCVSLTSAPDLPATSLEKECYILMFGYCTSLLAAPDLPATEVAELSYSGMFSFCSSLVSGPISLPATILSNSCYLGMFNECENLIYAPSLPATELAPGCYAQMFNRCYSLVTAPILPASHLVEESYFQMFSECVKLNHVLCLATDLTASRCTVNWLYGVSSQGTFVKSAKMNDWTRGESGIPEGWTVEDEGGSSSGISANKYLTFTSEGTTRLSLNNSGGNAPVVYYSFDANSWTQWDYSELEFNANKPLYICGDNPSGFSSSTSKYSYFTTTNSISISGDIMSLLNYKEDVTVIPSSYCFYSLFGSTYKVLTPPALPATTLTEGCYQSMFSQNFDLTTAPELPATTLAPSCYSGMFYLCRSLTVAPELPATTLANSCYDSMFSGCQNLKTAPELPASTLTSNCYRAMFDGCYNLEIAPVLPATTLASYCYEYMFANCKGLIEAPILPSVTMANYCYNGMFENCSGLVDAPDLPSQTLAYGCYYEMFKGCTSITVAPELPALTLDYYCYNGMFSGCTNLATAPSLPSTTLAIGCYANMFTDCIELTKAPDLPAANLPTSCYAKMFYNCNKLNSVKCLATELAYDSTNYWLYNVSPTGTFVKSAKMNDWATGASGIPEGWTVRNDGSNEYFDFEDWN